MIKLLAFLTISFGILTSGGVFASPVEEGLKALDEQEFSKAAKIFDDAYKSGDVEAGFYLGRMFELGVGTNVNWPTARTLYKDAANKGSAKALNRVGLMYYRGEPGELQNYTKAQEALCKSAELGDTEAQFNCAEMHKNGTAGKKDADAALGFYQKAAKENHVGALNQLGFIHSDKDAGKQDLKLAQSYFKRAADLGNPVGMFQLAIIFEVGKGQAADLVQAHKFYNLSGARGYVQAREGLARVTGQMTSAQILSAQTAAEGWEATPSSKKNDG